MESTNYKCILSIDYVKPNSCMVGTKGRLEDYQFRKKKMKVRKLPVPMIEG